MTYQERLDELSALWRGLRDRVTAYQARALRGEVDEVPPATVERLAETMRQFMAFRDQPGSPLPLESIVQDWHDDSHLRRWYELYYGWAGALARYVGRSDLPDAPGVPAEVEAADRAAETILDGLGGMFLAGVVIWAALSGGKEK